MFWYNEYYYYYQAVEEAENITESFDGEARDEDVEA